MKNFFKKNIDEISHDIVLRFTGLFLIFAHIVTVDNWLFKRHLFQLYSPDNYEVGCFPFFASCWKSPVLDFFNFKFLLYFYLIVSVITVLLFLFNKIRIAYFASILVFALKVFIFTSRYNVMGNYHTMHLMAHFVYLFLFQKRTMYVIFICAFYFFASLLKFNEEWMSGAALLRYPFVFGHSKYLILSLAYVVILESTLIWGLLINNRFIKVLTLIQLLFFHAYSYYIIGYFYPSIMFCVLSMVWLSLIWPQSDRKEINLKKLSPTNIGILIVVFVFNLYPKFIYKDNALNGKRRVLRMNMLDARTKCYMQVFLEKKDGSVKRLVVPDIMRSMRTHCDPVSYQALISRMCLDLSVQDKALKVFMASKRATSNKYSIVWKDENVCKN